MASKKYWHALHFPLRVRVAYVWQCVCSFMLREGIMKFLGISFTSVQWSFSFHRITTEVDCEDLQRDVYSHPWMDADHQCWKNSHRNLLHSWITVVNMLCMLIFRHHGIYFMYMFNALDFQDIFLILMNFLSSFSLSGFADLCVTKPHQIT